MRLLRKLAPSLLGLATALAQAPRAAAQPAQPAGPTEDELAQARDLFREGSKLAEAGNWEGARDRFARSLKLKYAAITLYNLGIADQETGHPVAAIECFNAFLAQPPEPATQPYTEAVRAALKTLEGRVPRIDVDLRPAGAPGVVLWIDGRAMPAAAGPQVMDPGRHEVVVSAPGFFDVRQTTWLVEGARANLALTLTPRPPPPPPPSIALPAALAAGGLACAVAGGVTFGVGARNGLSAPVDPGSAKIMTAGAVVGGAGAIALGVGFVLLLRRTPAKPQAATVAPWASGSVGGAQVRF
jgi:hypothetical protein